MTTKYGNVKISHVGFSFASKLEADLYDYLKILEMAGEYCEVLPQQHVRLTDANIVYIADFSALCLKDRITHYFEAKGFETDVWRIKRRLWMHYGPGPLHVFKRSGRGVYETEVIIPKN